MKKVTIPIILGLLAGCAAVENKEVSVKGDLEYAEVVNKKQKCYYRATVEGEVIIFSADPEAGVKRCVKNVTYNTETGKVTKFYN